MSDLEASTHEGHQLPPPRRLEPITNPAVTKKRKRTKKKDRPSSTTEDQDVAPPTTQDTPSLIGESMLSQLRSRLDPLYNPPPQISPLSAIPARLPPLEQSTSLDPPAASPGIEEGGNEQVGNKEGSSVRKHLGKSRKESRRRPKQRKDPTQMSSNPHKSELVPDKLTANAVERVGEQQEELRSTSKDSLIAGSRTDNERKKRKRRDKERPDKIRDHDVSVDIPDGTENVLGEQNVDASYGDSLPSPSSEVGVGRQGPGRQLPTLLSDGEDIQEATMADELATTGGIPTTRGEFVHPDDPQFLVAEEDVVEVAPEELHGTTRLFQPSQPPHSSASQPKEVIFVERRDGRGFVTQKKGATPSPAEVEQGLFSGEREISPSQFATYSHRVTQHIAFIAHGMVAGISLWDCVVSNILSRGSSSRHLDLLTFYHPLTLPANAVYVLLLSLVMLSLLDRFDFASMNRDCLNSSFKTPIQIILLIASSLVFFALILTLSVTAVDERIALYPHQPSLWDDVLTPINISAAPTQSTPLPTTHTDAVLSLVYIPSNNLISSRISPWLALTIVRAICCCISWMLVVWTKSFDRLLGYLMSVEAESSGVPLTEN